ncbi:unnamed protein product [Staurois parvus]|uniref:Uncharacterized protein n=1 Tax=Staurois parvus TaxID=386267 RepID=A0ABN9C833_9NEOB|nr:unnamed protein product [Staurois parvus]
MGQEKWYRAESIQDRRSGTVQSPYIQNKDRYRKLHPTYRTGRSGTVQSPYIQNKDRYQELHPAYRTGEVGLCKVHTYRIRRDTDNYTRHTGQEKWDCAESIHTE